MLADSTCVIRGKLTAPERRLIKDLTTPEKVQRWLARIPYNFEPKGETLRTFRGVFKRRQAHCLEAALFAATVLECHGHLPLLMDLESKDQLDHVVFVFRQKGHFGAVAHSRDPGLHGRKPVYRNLFSLAMSYAAPYIDKTGRLKGYGLLDLRGLRGDWRLSQGNVWFVERALIKNAHRPLRLSDAHYRRWHRRYLAFKARNPFGRPTYYSNQQNWL